MNLHPFRAEEDSKVCKGWGVGTSKNMLSLLVCQKKFIKKMAMKMESLRAVLALIALGLMLAFLGSQYQPQGNQSIII